MKKKKATVVAARRISPRAPKQSVSLNGRRRGGSLGLTVQQATVNRGRNIHASVRIIQGKPKPRMRRSIVMGSTTPPTELPAAMMPYAAERRLENHDATHGMDALKTALEPSPAATDCARKNWWYSVQKDIMTSPKRRKATPGPRSHFGP